MHKLTRFRNLRACKRAPFRSFSNLSNPTSLPPKQLFKGSKDSYEVAIGLEIHAQITSTTKLFSGAPVNFAAAPNSQVSSIDAALPGVLPVLNKECVAQAIKIGFAIGGVINPLSMFERKHYFYCDTPQGYQITQQRAPIVTGGKLDISEFLPNSEEHFVHINRIQLEQDSGKNSHDVTPWETQVDLNRCGVALLEIVSEPDIRSPEQATAFVKKIQKLVSHIDVCDGNMSEGSLRCDINISMNKPGEPFGERVEVKNVNTINGIMKSVKHEITRQIQLIESNNFVSRETRTFDAKSQTTIHMRSKEDMLDYRFFPEPDLPLLKLSQDFISSITSTIPELPDARAERFERDYGFKRTDKTVQRLLNDRSAARYFEEVVADSTQASKRAPNVCKNWVVNQLFRKLNKYELEVESSPVTPEVLGTVIDMVQNGDINGKVGSTVIDVILSGDNRTVTQLVEEEGWTQVSDLLSLGNWADEILDDPKYSKEVEKVRKGFASRSKKSKGVFEFLVGKVLRASNNKANAVVLRNVMQEKLANK